MSAGHMAVMAVTVFWVALAPEEDRAEEARSLESWAEEHGERLAPPASEAQASHAGGIGRAGQSGQEVGQFGRVADEVEALLDRARDAVAGRDAAAADAALDGAESALRVHPELPESAWLMAEVERARSMRWRRIAPADAEAADRAWARAEALDGGRTAGLGEEPAARIASFPGPGSATLSVRGVPQGFEIWLDGRLRVPNGNDASDAAAAKTSAGPHVVEVREERGGPIVWARWIEAGPGTSTLALTSLPAAPACSAADVSTASLASGKVDASRVRCDDWVAVAPGEAAGSVRVARCSRGGCGPFVEWARAPAWSRTSLALDFHESGELAASKPSPSWPGWATWGLIGAGAALVSGVVVVATGALQTAPTETRFVSGGIVRSH